MPRRRYELLFLPGLDEFVARECRSVLKAPVDAVPGRDDSATVEYDGSWARLLELRTPIAVFAVLTFPVPRPKSLLSGEYLPLISPRPLSDRPWRVRNLPGAVNAAIAAAITAATGPRPSDRVINLMCGSGTLLIERLLAAPARSAVGVDIDPEALDAARANLSAAGLSGRTKLVRSDVTEAGWVTGGPYDVILADPPWGGLVGEHRTNEELHLRLLQRAREAAAPDARVAILTHEIRQMERCLRETASLWRAESVTRVFQKGHHPRIYLLRPAGMA